MPDRPVPSMIGVVLAGGRGRRFDGRDKGLQRAQYKTLAEHTLAHMQSLPQRVISANRNLDDYAAFGEPVIADQRADFQGPLSGIESVMQQCPADWYAVCPADVLGAPDDWWASLKRQAEHSDALWVGTRDGDRVQPLLGLWSRRLLPQLSAYLDRGERRVMSFIEPWQDQALALPVGVHLSNLNTPQALADWVAEQAPD